LILEAEVGFWDDLGDRYGPIVPLGSHREVLLFGVTMIGLVTLAPAETP
jgi:hypothetical protein